jgi:transcriptional regulator with XRE-family HTH domain
MGMTQPVTTPVTQGVTGGSTTLNDRVAAQIRALMAARRRTSGELGQALGISQSAASRRMVGDGTFTLDQIQQAADWLGVPITDIITPVPGLDYSPGQQIPAWLYQGEKPSPK